MKTNASFKYHRPGCTVLLVVAIIFSSCGTYNKSYNSSATADSAIGPPDTEIVSMDSLSIEMDTARNIITGPAKGSALVYCPATMLRNIPSVINAVISKEDLHDATEKLAQVARQQNPESSDQQIRNDIRNSDINIYEKMKVVLEYDHSCFEQISKDEDPVKIFGQNKDLEWEWTIKPVSATSRSVISFLYYYVDPDNLTSHLLLKKDIPITVRIDNTEYLGKWKDFILGDPKNTMAAVIIPVVSFIGGFLRGKKKK